MYNNEVSEYCQSCPSTIETHEHLLRCPCNSRQVLRAKWLQQFDTFLSNIRHTPDVVRRLFYKHIYERCNSDTKPEIDIASYPDNIRQAYHQQTQIGWDHLLSGRLAIGWSIVIAKHLHHMKIEDSEMTVANWGKMVVQQIFGFIIQTWLQRNDEAHVRKSANESRLTRERLMVQILHLQESSPDIRYCDRDFVFKEPEVLAQYSLNNLRALHRASLSIIRSNKRRSKQSRSQPRITQHFDRLHQRPPTRVDNTWVPLVLDNSHHHVNNISNHHPQIEPDPLSVSSDHSNVSPTNSIESISDISQLLRRHCQRTSRHTSIDAQQPSTTSRSSSSSSTDRSNDISNNTSSNTFSINSE